MCEHNLTDEQIAELGDIVADRLAAKRKADDRNPDVRLTKEEALAVKHILATKRWAVRILLMLFASTALWALKDLYTLIVSHIRWGS